MPVFRFRMNSLLNLREQLEKIRKQDGGRNEKLRDEQEKLEHILFERTQLRRNLTGTRQQE